MKLRIETGPEYSNEPEVLIRCQTDNDEVRAIKDFIDKLHNKVTAECDGTDYVLSPDKILYFESVDGKVYIYDRERVYKSDYTLNDIEADFAEWGFFRCSKAIVVNMYSIESLKSEIGNRINATLVNGEHIIISRRYSSTFRKILKEATK